MSAEEIQDRIDHFTGPQSRFISNSEESAVGLDEKMTEDQEALVGALHVLRKTIEEKHPLRKEDGVQDIFIKDSQDGLLRVTWSKDSIGVFQDNEDGEEEKVKLLGMRNPEDLVYNAEYDAGKMAEVIYEATMRAKNDETGIL